MNCKYLTGFLILGAIVAGGAVQQVLGVSSTSIVFYGGGSVPIGGWASRWRIGEQGEVQIRYDFARGTGLVFSTGVNKSYWKSRSPQDVAKETQMRDIPPEFLPYTKILVAEEKGSLQNIPLGVSIYREGLIAGWRTYFGVGFVVNLWKFERSLNFQEQSITPLNDTTTYRENWIDTQDGAKMGFQVGTGFLYPLSKIFHLDVSLNYLYGNIGGKFGAILRYGKPARTWLPEKYKSYSGEITTLSGKVGIRFWL